eukprot:1184681-Prorocentrum_minimum.AAC.3
MKYSLTAHLHSGAKVPLGLQGHTPLQGAAKIILAYKAYSKLIPTPLITPPAANFSLDATFLDVARSRSDARPDFRSGRAKRASGGGSREGGRATSRKLRLGDE